MPLNCGGGDWTPQRVVSLLDCKEIQPVHPKGNQSWIFIGRTDAEAENSNTLATWYEELTHWKRPWCWERLKVGGEGDDRGWDGWLVPPIWWTWVWVSSRSWWWTGKPGVLQSMGSQRVGHDWVTDLNYIICWYTLENYKVLGPVLGARNIIRRNVNFQPSGSLQSSGDNPQI